MKNTTVSFVIICVIGAFLVFGASIDFNRDEDLLGAVWIASLVVFLLYVWFTSVFVMRPDHMIPSFFLGTFQGTYVSGTFVNKRNKYDQTMLQCGGQRGLFGTDIVLLLWPLYRGVIFPTGAITVYVHAKVFTKNTADSPSVPVHIDFALVFGLTPNLSDFFTVFDVLSYECNLAETVPVEYTLELDSSEEEGEGGKKKKGALTAKYNDLRIAQVIIDSGGPALR